MQFTLTHTAMWNFKGQLLVVMLQLCLQLDSLYLAQDNRQLKRLTVGQWYVSVQTHTLSVSCLNFHLLQQFVSIVEDGRRNLQLQLEWRHSLTVKDDFLCALGQYKREQRPNKLLLKWASHVKLSRAAEPVVFMNLLCCLFVQMNRSSSVLRQAEKSVLYCVLVCWPLCRQMKSSSDKCVCFLNLVEDKKEAKKKGKSKGTVPVSWSWVNRILD